MRLLLVGGLQHQIAHVVGWLTIGRQDAEDVDPEDFPLLLAPGVIALKAGNVIGEPVAEQLTVGAVLGIEVGGAHRPGRTRDQVQLSRYCRWWVRAAACRYTSATNPATRAGSQRRSARCRAAALSCRRRWGSSSTQRIAAASESGSNGAASAPVLLT